MTEGTISTLVAARVLGEGEGAEGEQAGAGARERVGHRRGGDEALPGGCGIRHAVGPA